MDKLMRFIDCYVSTETCNLRCAYCYIAQQNKFSKKLVKFTHTPEEIAKALSKERLGGTCLLNFCAGGETLLSEDVIPVIKALLEEGHYVMVVTNGTMDRRFEEMARFPQTLKSRLFFKFSFHYLELKRLNWLEKFRKNVMCVYNAGCSITIEVTPSDELIPYIDELKRISEEYFGALCHVTIARNDVSYKIGHLSKLDFEAYKDVWGTFGSELFDFKSKIFYKHRTEFCYAGEYTLSLNISDGTLKQCYCGKVLCNIYDNIQEQIPFRAIGHACGYYHCYNGHVFLPMGAIPNLKGVPEYDFLRNKTTNTGREWLQPEMKAFMHQKVSDNKPRYSLRKKILSDICSFNLIIKAKARAILRQKG